MIFAPPTDLELQNERLRTRNGELLLQLAKATGEKPKGSDYLRALVAQYAAQEELTNYFGTWHELRCECGTRLLYHAGDCRDVTTLDVEAVQCWSCAKVLWLGDESEEKPDDWREGAVESYRVPDAREANRDEYRRLAGKRRMRAECCTGKVDRRFD